MEASHRKLRAELSIWKIHGLIDWSQFTNPETPGYVGFANLPNQVHRKSVKKGFEFTLMVVGESGLGKSTLINSLFLTDLYPERIIPGAAGKEMSCFALNSYSWLLQKIERTVQIEASTVEIEERGVKLRLTVVDTPGYGDAINSQDCFNTIISYIDDQFERYLHDESGLNRRHIVDNRVHCCFYFISPLGHGLKPLDVQFMKAIHNKVLDEIEEHDIKIYHLPDAESDEDEDFKEQTRILKASIPFAVVGSNQQIEAKGKKVRGRLYPWGVVEVENPEHNDFLKLRTMLITHMQDLQEVTQDLHYENFRSERLKRGGRLSSHGYILPLSPAYVSVFPHFPFTVLPVTVTAVTHYHTLQPCQSTHNAGAHRQQTVLRDGDRQHPSHLHSASSVELSPGSTPERGAGEAGGGGAGGARKGAEPAEMDKDMILREKEAELRRMQEMIAKMQAQMQKQGEGKGNGQPVYRVLISLSSRTRGRTIREPAPPLTIPTPVCHFTFLHIYLKVCHSIMLYCAG
ncbi:hypothetical protein JZ751_019073 [Albula glossodonta]|uniref:Septin-type G domain-containing protein n=1 Tax=Albula glossodonta TaxID=121402 RepID=A0A8T2NQU0_9TELE|nr:hypothetical protein JZ751_019073 [Albula glossodonta]